MVDGYKIEAPTKYGVAELCSFVCRNNVICGHCVLFCRCLNKEIYQKLQPHINTYMDIGMVVLTISD